MSAYLLVGLTLMSSVAAAERAVEVDVDPRAPFAAAELVDALRVRLDPDGAPVQLRVSEAQGRITVSGSRGARTVPLDGRTGADAARLVALAAVDLALDDLAAAPTSESPPRPIERHDTPPGLTAAADARRVQSPIAIGVLGTAAAWSSPLAGVAIDVAIPRRRWLAAFELGAGELVDDRLDLVNVVARAGAGARVGWLELRAGATVVPIKVTTGAGDQTVLFGAGASIRLRVPIAEGTALVVGGGADAFATRTVYVAARQMIATPWVTPWLAAGIEMTP